MVLHEHQCSYLTKKTNDFNENLRTLINLVLTGTQTWRDKIEGANPQTKIDRYRDHLLQMLNGNPMSKYV